MKILATFIILSSLFTLNAMACEGGVYIGSRQDAALLQNKELRCFYNGEDFLGKITISTPRCLNARPVVKLKTSQETLNVMNLNVKLIRGIAKYTYKVRVDAVEADRPIICNADRHEQN